METNLLLWMLAFAGALRLFWFRLGPLPLVAVATPETATFAHSARH
jgi:hypothetical protein